MTGGTAAAAKPDAATTGLTAAAPVTPARLMAMLQDGEELALLDVREELIYSRAHLLHARSAPLSRLEVCVPRLVPRRGTRVALVDDGGGLADMAAAILQQHGYKNLFVLGGGITAWSAAGYELFSGVNVVSKAFGEVVEHATGTSSVDPLALKQMIDRGDDLVVLDSRPFDEFARVSIPTATNVPGAEL